MVTDAKLFLWSPSWGMKKLPSEKSDFPPQNLVCVQEKAHARKTVWLQEFTVLGFYALVHIKENCRT